MEEATPTFPKAEAFEPTPYNSNGEAVASDQWGGAEEKAARRRKRPFGRQRFAAKGKQEQKSGKEKSATRPKFSKRRPSKNMQKKDASVSAMPDQEIVHLKPRKKMRPHKAKKSARDTQRTRTARTESTAKNRPAITKNRKAGRRRSAAAHRPL